MSNPSITAAPTPVKYTTVYCELRDQKQLDDMIMNGMNGAFVIYSRCAFTPSDDSNTHIKFGGFKVVEEPAGIKVGGSVRVRECKLVEDPARKEVLLHVTCGWFATFFKKLTNEVLGSLDVVDTGEVCPLVVRCKTDDSTEWKEVEFASSFKWVETVRSIKRAKATGSLKPEALASFKRSLMGL